MTLTFETDPTQDCHGHPPAVFLPHLQAPSWPLVWGERFNRRAAFYSGISSAWAQMRLDLINWCCGCNSLGAKENGKA